ncbi:MAG: hypothetical protein AB8I08_18270 [Sandaracinaceae bacterium]
MERALTELSYRFRLSDGEFRRVWLTEYYRRPGWRSVRIVAGPALVALGISSLRAGDLFNRVMGGVCVAFGLYYALKPFLAAWMLTKQRKQSGVADQEIGVTFTPEGVEIDQGGARTELGWDDVRAAGSGARYVWYELNRGARATIPMSAIDDPAALEALLREHTEWVGPSLG